MISLRLYYFWFFIICLLATLIVGILAAILPNSVGGVLTAIPYLIAIIFVLFRLENKSCAKFSLMVFNIFFHQKYQKNLREN